MSKPVDFRWEHQAYDYNYNDRGCTGYEGWDPHRVVRNEILPARRAQVGPRGMYKAGLVELPDGRLLASPVNMLAPRVQSPMPSGAIELTWPVHLYESTDAGESWHRFEHSPLVGKEGSLHCLPSGVLLFTSESLDGVYVSEDLGVTWRAVPFPGEPLAEFEFVSPMRSPIVHGDGTISFVRCVGTLDMEMMDEPRPVNPRPSRAWLVHSYDGGRTWNESTPVTMDWDHPFPFFTEADCVRLSDKHILAASRYEWHHPLKDKPLPYPPRTMRNDHAAGHMVLMESHDDGRSWSAPRDFLNYSEVQGQLTRLADGRLLCTYTHYHHPFGVAAVLSNDNGITWDHQHPYQLAWSSGAYTGWGTTRQLKDGSLVTIHALEPYNVEPAESGRTVCQTIKWHPLERGK